MSKNTNTAESEILKAMENALKFRNTRDKVKQSIEDADTSISKLKNMIAEKRAQKKNAEKKLRQYQNEEKLIKAIALIPSPETEKKNRVFYSTQCFFNLLNLFDQEKAKDFSNLYNSLHDTKTLAKIVMESSKYGHFTKDALDPENDYVVIKGKLLRQKIKEELEKQKSNIEMAKIKLDEAYNEEISKSNPKNKKSSDESSAEDDKSEDKKQ